MPEKLWETIKEWRDKGVAFTDEVALSIYQFCLRKMEVAKVENPDEYIFLLYPDAVKEYLFSDYVNTVSILRMYEKEVCSKCVHCV